MTNYDTAIAQHEALQAEWERISAGIDLVYQLSGPAISPREEGGRRFATQVALATLGIDPNNWPPPKRNELAEREDADKRRKFPWRFGDRGGEA